MRGPVLLDTGPLVAALANHEKQRSWAQVQFDQLDEPFLTCEAVITEACFLLRGARNAAQAVLEFLARDAIRIVFRLGDEAEAVSVLMARYANVPMSLADACLVRMAEIHPGARILTLDRDFLIYRMHGRQAIPTIMPENGF